MVNEAPENGSDIDASAWQLIDPRPIRSENPYTFFVPSAAEKAAIVPGDLVKLMFRSLATPEGTERMWVTVIGRDHRGIHGDLDNQPLDIPGLSAGDRIRFQEHHVVGVWAPKVDDVTHEDRMFARCHVDPRVLSGAVPIGRIERRRTLLSWLRARKDGWPDTGWYIFANDGVVPRRRDMRYVALGLVLNSDDSMLPHIADPVGTRLFRDGDIYRPA